MERAYRTSWRLTFIAWSCVFVLWVIVTVAIDYETLLFIRRLTGVGGDGAITLVALMIAVPLLFDAGRNLQGTYHLWRRRSLNDPARSTWSARVPAVTPRRFRERGADELTRRERVIVEQGQLVHGVVEQHGELTSVRFAAPWGVDIATRPVVVSGEQPRAGSRSPILFEPGARVGVAPELHGLEFFAAEADDLRRSLPEQLADQRRVVDKLRIPLHASLHPIHRASGAGLSEVGTLAFDGVKLSLTSGDTEPCTVRLDQPFRVELSTFLLPGGLAELNVSIEARTHSAYRAGDLRPVCFKTELPQTRIDRRLTHARIDAFHVTPRDFDSLWTLLVSHADDDTLTASVSLASS